MIPPSDENPFRDNPYASPASPSGGTPFSVPPAPPSQTGMVRHVPLIGILMIIQGGLEVCMALVLIGMGAFWPAMMALGEAQGDKWAPPRQEAPPEMFWLMGAMYGLFGAVVLGAAVLHIVAGIRNYKFRSRVLGIIALVVGMAATLLCCYCAPSAIALGVYGLICLTNPEVVRAFELARRSKDPAPDGISSRSLPGH